MKELPIGIQSIKKILAKGDCIYVDKTPFAYNLISGITANFFLSRPRRFGKSLFLDTLAEIFKGNKELFKDCAIYHTDYDWQPYPVLIFDFLDIDSSTVEGFKTGLKEALEDLAELYGLTISGSSLQSQLKRLVRALAKKGPVVVLVDEYDRPIVHNLERPAVAEANRELLSDFFGTFKSLSKYLRFLFITGISRFAQVSIFSSFNNLEDLTMDPAYSAMLGYTEEELKSAFNEHLSTIAQERGVDETAILTELKEWYNGYRFSKAPKYVYNPFSTLKYMRTREADSYWYTTGTPSFLIQEIQKRPTLTTSLAGISVSQTALMNIRSIEDIDLPTLMFQTGYLTIQDWEWDKTLKTTIYKLNFPNEEVHQAFFQSLITDLGKLIPQAISEHAAQLQKELISLDLPAAIKTLNIQFAKIPYHAFQQAKEGFYQAIMLLCLELSGLRTYGEVYTNLGRIDLVVQLPKHTFIFELKVDQPAAIALDQIHSKRYKERYLKEGKEIVAVAMSFSTETRNIGQCNGGLYTAQGELVKELAGI